MVCLTTAALLGRCAAAGAPLRLDAAGRLFADRAPSDDVAAEVRARRAEVAAWLKLEAALGDDLADRFDDLLAERCDQAALFARAGLLDADALLAAVRGAIEIDDKRGRATLARLYAMAVAADHVVMAEVEAELRRREPEAPDAAGELAACDREADVLRRVEIGLGPEVDGELRAVLGRLLDAGERPLAEEAWRAVVAALDRGILSRLLGWVRSLDRAGADLRRVRVLIEDGPGLHPFHDAVAKGAT